MPCPFASGITLCFTNEVMKRRFSKRCKVIQTGVAKHPDHYGIGVQPSRSSNMNNKVLQGTYADFKIVKSRAVAQIIVEIPLESAQAAVEMFGVPNPSYDQWVAVAALHRATVTQNQDAVNAVKQAGMLCNTESFGEFLRETSNPEVRPNVPDDITTALRGILGIKSRTEFHDDPDLVMAFNRIKGNYEQWLMAR